MQLIIRKNIKILYTILYTLGIFFSPHAQTLSGKVVDERSSGIEGALVEIANADMSTKTGYDGSWSISIPVGFEDQLINRQSVPAFAFKGNILYFVVKDKFEDINVNIFTTNGRLVYKAVDRQLSKGFYALNPVTRDLNSNMNYVMKVRTGSGIAHFKLHFGNRSDLSEAFLRKTSEADIKNKVGLAKKTAVIDTVKASKAGYTSDSKTIESYNESSITLTLKTITADYHLDPPNPCYNQFTVEGCVDGDASSTCGGKCVVANACSPPEDPNKADKPMTFICPRFMLFSSAMIQAAKDDAELYGWGNTDDPPFNYAIVGHDADPGGLDDGESSCCQCYQLIYETPEPSSPQPPELPYPKSLVVQSFNTAASGPTGFDVFMGAGGYGAFNACYNDPEFDNTSQFGVFIYDGYPYQNPWGGGISFLRYQEECYPEWPPTVGNLQSSACQDKIKQLCNQAQVNASQTITEDTRRSCIQTNKVESLYHQNWEVRAKRVQCPYNLTRVTGCRLLEDHLPMPLPKVQTPSDADANGTFSSGYHTTTMQDCCKPTCAWKDWVTGKGLPADGEWNSFYSCDKNGNPITK